MTNIPDHDPCDALGRIGPPPQDDRLRRDVWRRVQGWLRRRRWWRRAAVVAALAACYAVGFGTARLGSERVPAESVPGGGGTPSLAGTGPATPPPPSPLAQEWQALDSAEPRPDLARQAGDRYAAEEGDYQSALRCYRDALDAGPDHDLAIRPNDSWLLMVLKDARQKEKRDDRPHE